MTEASGFEACGRARLDDATVFGADLVDGARIHPGRAHIEPTASLAGVLDEPKVRRSILKLGVELEEALAHPLFVGLEQMHGLGAMVTATPTLDAVPTVRIGLAGDGFQASDGRRDRHGSADIARSFDRQARPGRWCPTKDHLSPGKTRRNCDSFSPAVTLREMTGAQEMGA